MLLGYNTNGFAHHRLEDALAVLSEIGYRSVAVTLERDLIDPPDRRGVADCAARLRQALAPFDFSVTIEAGSRFILDPRRKHQPTLISRDAAERSRRIEFIKAAVDVAAEIGARSVSLWSGAPEGEPDDGSFDRLTASLTGLLDHAESRHVRLSFEPEPGMLIQTMAEFERLHEAIGHPLFGLTLDIGHVHCLGDGDLLTHVKRWRGKLWNVHVEDMCVGRHEHLMFGEGEMNFAAVVSALKAVDYDGPVHVELSRHSHDAVDVARRSFEFLRPFV